MSVALETFVKQLTDSGVLAAGKLDNFIPPRAHPKDAQELAKQLVKQKQLTRYQAAEIYQGRAKSLILGGYTILDKIGAGGMGQVFKAEHRKMHRTVAIKMLPPAVTKDPLMIARFQREVEAAARLEHPNIVTAYDADEAGGVHFLVMQFVDGSDLSALVKRDGPVSVQQAINYILQAARGLEYAHHKGIIHRDIKPANLLLSSEGTLKILDMGLARIQADGSGETQAELTGTGAVMGTVDYMSPEQAFNSKHADARADIYSLGCTLYYLLAGKPAYGGETVIEKILAHREKPIPSLKDLQAGVPKLLEAIYRRMVAKHAEDRYQSMSEVVADLQECVSETSTAGRAQPTAAAPAENSNLSFLAEADPPTHHPKAAKAHKPNSKPKSAAGWNRRQRLALGGGLLGALILLAGVLLIVRTKHGTLLVEIDQPDATVKVLNEEGELEITQPGGKGKVSISVDPGKHRLKIEKDGFAVFGQDFVIESGGTQSIKATLEDDKPWLTSGFKQWKKETAAKPAEEQVKAVRDKLVELNPGFDGKVGHEVEEDVVVFLRLTIDNVTDISPVTALVELKHLCCEGSPLGIGKLSDLTPLKGVPLTILEIIRTNVSDLSPLRNMPLSTLNCGLSPVSDLSPLKGMALTTLQCYGTQVSDLSPLKGMPLTNIGLDNTRVADLSPLEGMLLTQVACSGTKATNLSPLRGMPLKYLYTVGCDISDYSFLKDMPLRELRLDFKPSRDAALLRSINTLETINNKPAAEFWKEVEAQQKAKKPGATFETTAFQKWEKATAAKPAEEQAKAVRDKLVELNPGFDGKETHEVAGGVVTKFYFDSNEVADISPLRALKSLGLLVCGGAGTSAAKLSDLSPLKGLPIGHLYCSNVQVSDLSPLAGMPLTIFDCSRSPVADLTPLEGMKLTRLGCWHTKVSDLSPLRGMPLTELNCFGTPVSDLSPLRGIKLTGLYFSWTHVADLAPLEGMPLTHLEFTGTQVSNLTPLQGMNLSEVWLTPKSINKGMKVLRAMTNLQAICISQNEEDKFTPAEFWKKYDAGVFGPPDPAATPDRKPSAAYLDPAFKKWEQDTAKLPPQAQIKAVVKKLQELNPGYDGKVTGGSYRATAAPWIENGVVTEFGFADSHVADISPVRAFKALKSLMCVAGADGQGRISDLSPIAGMQLTGLICASMPVSDLSPLKGMPLVHLDCYRGRVSDLSPLKGMQLTGLSVQDMPVVDLSPLEGMPLTILTCGWTQVADLSPLKGMPLTHLGCVYTAISDLSPLKGMKLTEFYCDHTRVSDLSPLAGMNLKMVSVTPKDIVKGLDVIRQMNSLEKIRIDVNQDFYSAEFWQKYDAGEFGKPDAAPTTPDRKPSAAYLDPAFKKWEKKTAALPAEEQIKAVAKKLQQLNPGYDGKVAGSYWALGAPKIENGVVTGFGICDENVTDISPVRAFKGLQSFCAASPDGIGRLTDLSPLNGMPLTGLICASVAVSDLSPLKDMPLTSLYCHTTGVSDLSPLRGMKLTHLSIQASPLVDLSPLQGMPLTELTCGWTRVADLSPLKGMPLTLLFCRSTAVSDLSPLKGTKLAELSCDHTQVSDLSPLTGMSLKTVSVTPANIVKGLDIIRQMKSLEKIGVGANKEFTPVEFWQKYDAGEFK